jgi:hypothetical protein
LDMLRKLLDTISLKWAKKSRISQILQIQKGIGNHPYLTLKDSSLYLHAYPSIEGMDTSVTEEIKQSYLSADATTSEVEVPFTADFINKITNYGTDDVYLNFNIPTTSEGTITLKPGDELTEFPRKVRTLFYRSKSGYQNFEILGVYTNMLYYQEVVLDGMTIDQLYNTLVSMGYMVDPSEAERLGMMDESALLLMPASGVNLMEASGLYAFTSNWYRVTYPIYRVLSTLDGDVETAIRELTLPSARGDWLDYWASFFRIKRLEDESDELMLRRVMLTLTSAKSNNMAMEELVSYYIGTEAQVLDKLPAQIEVRVDPMYMDTASKVREIIGLLKGAGVDYFINYQKVFDESYPVYFRDINGKTVGELNETFSQVVVQLPIYTEDYLYVPPELRNGWRLNTSRFNFTSKLSKSDLKVIESVGMTMTDSAGNTIQQM